MDHAQKVKIVEDYIDVVVNGRQFDRIVEDYIAAYNAGDEAAILRLYAPDASMEDPVGDAPVRGHEAIAALYREGFAMGIQLELDGSIRSAEGAVIFPLCATTSGAKLFIIDLFELDATGRIARMRAYWSRDNMIGELPA